MIILRVCEEVKKIRQNIVAILWLLIATTAISFAQAPWTLGVRGSVMKAGRKLDGAIVTVYIGSTQAQQVTTSSGGKFSFELDPDKDYTLSFTKPGHITKKITISTRNVPSSRSEHGFADISMDISIFEDIPGTDLSGLLRNPIAKYYYIAAEEEFNYDAAYTQSIQEQLNKIKLAEEEARKKAAENKAALEAELKAITEKYNAAIAKGDAAYKAKDYANAKAGYSEASTIKPNEQYPKDKIKEIDALIANEAKEKAANEKYAAAIAKADAAFAAKDYTNARAGYVEAVGYKPANPYPKNKLKEIDDLLANEAKNKEINEKYNAAITKADAALAAKKYPEAKAGYNEALGIKPAEQYPKTKLKEIDDLIAKEKAEQERLAKEKELTEKYNAAIAKGDAAFKTTDYDAAKGSYTEASTLKPTEKYPKDKLAEIAKILVDKAAKEASEKEKEAKYSAAIKKGDAAFGAKDYANAKAAYVEASAIKPAEQYPKTKIAEIDKILLDIANAEKAKAAAEKALNDKYVAAISKGDKAFAVKDWTNAKAGYTSALELKSAEQYPKDQLKKIDEEITKAMGEKERLAKEAAEKALNEKYAAAIAKGDKSFGAKDWTNSKAAYNAAIEIKSTEQYPKDQLKKIDEEITKAMGEKERLAKEAAEKALNDKYNAAIAKGDKSFGAKDWTNSKAAYMSALELKSTEQYPKDKLKEIEVEIAKSLSDKEKAAKEAAEKALNDKYNAAIAKGDKAFGVKDWTNAKAAYMSALELKSSEQYPKDQLKKIDEEIIKALGDKEILAKEAAEKALNEKYVAAIAKGDKAFGVKDWTNAKASYSAALGLKPAEQYPKDKLKEIEAEIAKSMSEKDRLAKEAAEKALNDKYNAAIAKGDKAFGVKDWTNAKAAYMSALELKSIEQYPKDKLKEIEAIIAQSANEKDRAAREAAEKALNEKYQSAIERGDKSMGVTDYANAKAAYKEANSLKPLEDYPKIKIREIDAILAKEAAEKNRLSKEEAEKLLNEKYQAAISRGDNSFSKSSYADAQVSYKEALGLKPMEQYPKDKLKEIDALIAKEKAEKARLAREEAEKALNEKYQAAITKGDNSLSSSAYADAQLAYKEALTIKPLEQYPKDKLKEIDELIAKEKLEKARLAREAAEKALNEKYQAAITKGDNALSSNDYANAKSGYKEALTIKPMEDYPKVKLREIDALIAKEAAEKARLAKEEAEKALNEKYQTAISKGDNSISAKEYDAAKSAYKEALTIKPTEQYPKDKLKEIDALILAEKQEKDRLAREAIEKEKAEKERILNEKYQAAISAGDNAFASKDYPTAKTSYLEANTIKPLENYPKVKLKEIDKAIADEAAEKKRLEREAAEKEINDKYNDAISQADGAFGSSEYKLAKTHYSEALTIKPVEVYPKNKIAEINKILNDIAIKEKQEKDRLEKERILNEKYDAVISKGDNGFSAKQYDVAKFAYKEGSLLKPNEQYPKDKLAEVEDLIAKEKAENARIAAEKLLNEKYLIAISKADKLLSLKDYNNAKITYQSASTLKPEEQYPKDKIAEIETTLADIAAKAAAEKERLAIEKDIKDRYTNAIKKGDASLFAKNYESATQAYNEALTIKADEVYPKNKIAEIEKILADNAAKAKAEEERLARQKEINEKYDAIITQADDAFRANDYNAAKPLYIEASSVKPTEIYPKNKITEIDKVIAAAEARERAERDRIERERIMNEKFDLVIAKADNLLADKNYVEAKASYKQALIIKPNEQYPKDKIADIDRIIAAANAIKIKEQKYQATITIADKYFASKDYKIAKTSYLDASAIKPEEQYPKQKIAEIERLLGESKVQNVKVNNDPKRAFIDSLVSMYPQGPTTETTVQGKTTVVKVIVVKGNEAWVYRKTITSYGAIYYFKNGTPITKETFDAETR